MFFHTVAPGETLWSIANKYGLYPAASAINQIIVANRLWRSPYIVPMQRLSIPSEGLYYIVKKGDTLWAISNKLNITVSQLMSLNNIYDPTLLYIGQIIKLLPKTFDPSKYLICIDPGHQAKGNIGMEPIAPGSDIKKQKVSSGTQGVATGKPEYVLNLEVGLKVQYILKLMGYQVLMTRTIHSVDISNVDRALMANAAGADLCVRLHADGAISKDISGISVLYPAQTSPNTDALKYRNSKLLAELLLKNLIETTNANSRGIIPRSDLTGFNWSDITVALVEMGYMTNPEEDRKMATTEYQYLLAEGIADGVSEYLKTTPRIEL